MIFKKFYSSPIGILEILEEDGFIVGLKIVSCYEEKINKNKSTLLEEACYQLEEYFSLKRKYFDLPIKLKGTSFQEKVWKEIQKIPYGETKSYKDIAVSIKNSNASQAVGQANAKNKIIIFIPCHRVINKNKNIGGFAYGQKIKEKLLNLEKSHSIL